MDPYLIGKQRGLTDVLWYSKEINASLSGLGTSEAMLREQPDVARRFLRASIKGLRYYKTHKDESVALAVRLLDQAPALASASYDLNQPLRLDEPLIDERVQRDFLELARGAERPAPGGAERGV